MVGRVAFPLTNLLRRKKTHRVGAKCKCLPLPVLRRKRIARRFRFAGSWNRVSPLFRRRTAADRARALVHRADATFPSHRLSLLLERAFTFTDHRAPAALRRHAPSVKFVYERAWYTNVPEFGRTQSAAGYGGGSRAGSRIRGTRSASSGGPRGRLYVCIACEYTARVYESDHSAAPARTVRGGWYPLFVAAPGAPGSSCTTLRRDTEAARPDGVRGSVLPRRSSDATTVSGRGRRARVITLAGQRRCVVYP